MTDLNQQLEHERQLINAATYGPWFAEYSREQGHCVLPPDAESTREAVAVTRLFDQQADSEFIAHARTALPQRNAQLQAVLELHKPDEDGEECDGCMNAFGDPTRYPCPTVRAIEEAME